MNKHKWWLQDTATDGDAAGTSGGNALPPGAGTGAPDAGEGKPPRGSAGGNGAVKGDGAGAGPVWPDNWRELYAGADEKKLQRLSRYASPSAAFDAMLAAQSKISAGEMKSTVPFPDKGTPEEQNAWRKEHGVPEAPDKYDLNFGDGLVIGDEDQPIVKSFLTAAHGAHMPAETAKAALKWYIEERDRMAEAQYQQDVAFKTESEDALRAEWGQDFTRNRNLIKNLLASAPEGLAERLMQGRLSDGKPIGSDPAALKWLIGLSLELNPTGTVLPAGGGDRGAVVDDEISQIEKFMRENRQAYNKDEKKQARLRDLYTMRDKLGKKS